jgi:hypothetical protein
VSEWPATMRDLSQIGNNQAREAVPCQVTNLDQSRVVMTRWRMEVKRTLRTARDALRKRGSRWPHSIHSFANKGSFSGRLTRRRFWNNLHALGRSQAIQHTGDRGRSNAS